MNFNFIKKLCGIYQKTNTFYLPLWGKYALNRSLSLPYE